MKLEIIKDPTGRRANYIALNEMLKQFIGNPDAKYATITSWQDTYKSAACVKVACGEVIKRHNYNIIVSVSGGKLFLAKKESAL